MVVGLETKRKQLVSTSIVKVLLSTTVSFYTYIKVSWYFIQYLLYNCKIDGEPRES